MLLIVTLTPAALAEDGVKVTYFPGMNRMGRRIEIHFGSAPSPDDDTIAKIYDKVKAVEATGELDYIVPDASFLTLEVTYKDQTISTSNTIGVVKVPGHEAFQQAWDEAYALVWEILKPRFEP